MTNDEFLKSTGIHPFLLILAKVAEFAESPYTAMQAATAGLGSPIHVTACVVHRFSSNVKRKLMQQVLRQFYTELKKILQH